MTRNYPNTECCIRSRQPVASIPAKTSGLSFYFELITSQARLPGSELLFDQFALVVILLGSYELRAIDDENFITNSRPLQQSKPPKSRKPYQLQPHSRREDGVYLLIRMVSTIRFQPYGLFCSLSF